MYVPGSLNDVDNVLVDVGTGYYVEKVTIFTLNDNICGIFSELVFPSLQNVDDSKAFFKRKIEFLTKQIEKIQPVLQEKHAMKQGKPGLNSQNGLISSYTMNVYLSSVNLQMVGCA